MRLVVLGSMPGRGIEWTAEPRPVIALRGAMDARKPEGEAVAHLPAQGCFAGEQPLVLWALADAY